MKWSEYPFLRLTIAIVLGILLNNLVKADDFLCYLLLMFYMLFFGIYFISFWRRTTKFGKKYEGILALSSFMLLGYMTSQLNFVMEKPQFSQEELKSGSHYTISLISNPAKTDKTTKYEAIIDKIKINEVWFDVDEKAIIYLTSKDSAQYQYGDQLIVKGKPEYFKQQTNSHAFDYSKYMSRRGFYLQDFVRQNQILWVNNESKNPIKYFSLMA